MNAPPHDDRPVRRRSAGPLADFDDHLQGVGERPFGFRRDKEHTRVPVIPKPHRDKEGNGGENGFGKGQDDAEKNPEIPRAVDDRRRFEILRKSHKVRAHDEHIEHTHIRGEIHHFARIPKPQLFYDQIIGNHAAAEIHGEQKIDEKNLFSGQFSPRQRIGGKRRYDQLIYRPHDGDIDGIDKRPAEIVQLIGKHRFVAVELKGLRPERKRVEHDVLIRHERFDKYVPEGKDDGENEYEQEYRVYYFQNTIAGRQFHFAFHVSITVLLR